MHGYNEMNLSAKTVKFKAYRSGVQALGCDKYGHVVQMYLILKKILFYSNNFI